MAPRCGALAAALSRIALLLRARIVSNVASAAEQRRAGAARHQNKHRGGITHMLPRGWRDATSHGARAALASPRT